MRKVGIIVILVLLLTYGYKYGINTIDKDSYSEQESFLFSKPENSKEIINVNVEACFSDYYRNIPELYEDADNIIIGIVESIVYSDKNADPISYCTINVVDSLKGNITNEKIVIKEKQGYCRLSQYIQKYGDEHFKDNLYENIQDIYFSYAVDGEPLVEVGDTFVYFLSPKLSDENYEYYVPIAIYMGKYRLDEEGLYSRYCPIDGMYDIVNKERMSVLSEGKMTLREIENEIKYLEK